MSKPILLACDLEGVFIPEIWIAVAQATGIEALKKTTRDIKDYDELMAYRLKILDEKKLTLGDIQKVIETMDVEPGAREFLDKMREQFQVVILSDTFYEFARPFMRKLGHPTLFCHQLHTDASGKITSYELRLTGGKKKATVAFQELGFKVIAMGDSYNDTGMLLQADKGFLFRAPENVIAEFPQLQALSEYSELEREIASEIQKTLP
jgi:phosphoserine/homoserine phosphotransferase